MTHWYVCYIVHSYVWHNAFVRMTRRIDMICVIWCIHTSLVIHLYVWHDACTWKWRVYSETVVGRSSTLTKHALFRIRAHFVTHMHESCNFVTSMEESCHFVTHIYESHHLRLLRNMPSLRLERIFFCCLQQIPDTWVSSGTTAPSYLNHSSCTHE